jgi:DUF4097 and DUF4098 domain-containing protein YvlB
MSDRHEQFVVGEHPRVEVTGTSGSITIREGGAGIVEVRLDGTPDQVAIDQVGDTVIIGRPRGGFLRRMWSSDVVVTVPAGTAVLARNGSGDIHVDVPVSELDAAVASGDVRVHRVAGNAVIKAASGDIWVKHVDGRLDLNTASGDARIGTVGGDVASSTSSGDVAIDRVGGAASLRTASGDLTIRRFDGDELSAKILSGDLEVGIPARRRISVVLDSLSGRLRNRLPEGDGSPPEKEITVRATTVSGDVTLHGV